MADKIEALMALVEKYAEARKVGKFSECFDTRSAVKECARALAQGEPGEAFGTYVEYSDGTTAFRKRGEPFAPTVLGGTVWTLYLSPTASAPAAERETRDLEIEGVVSWLRSHDLLEEADKVQRLCGIGTKEPTNG